MKSITVVGIGNQGAKAVRAMYLGERGAVNRVLINAPGELIGNESTLTIPFVYEFGAWSPEYQLKTWFFDPDNMETLEAILEPATMVIICAGLGGTCSFIAKYLIMFMNEMYPEKIVLFAGTTPFREEQDYFCNSLCRRMIDFLQEHIVPYTTVENRIIRSFFHEYTEAYENSCRFLAKVIEGIISISIHREEMDIRQFFCKDFFLYEELEIDCIKDKIESLFGNDMDGMGVFGEICIKEFDFMFMMDIAQIYDRYLEMRFGKINAVFWDDESVGDDKAIIRMVGRGMESKLRIGSI